MENFLIYFRFLEIFLDSATSPFVVKIDLIHLTFQESKKNFKNFSSIFFSVFSVAELEKNMVIVKIHLISLTF